MHNTPDVIVLCGGAGTRLRSVTGDTPKPMALVAGRPFLELLLTQVERHGFRRVILAVGFNADVIRSHFGNSFKALELVYSEESTPLGTGGALRRAARLVTSQSVLVTNGDSYTDANLRTLVDEFERRAPDALLLLAPADGRADCGNVLVDERGVVTDFSEKTVLTSARHVNAGIYILSRRVLDGIPEGLPVSLEKELLPCWVHQGRRVEGLVEAVQCVDIGTPDRYRIAQQKLKFAEEYDRPGVKGV